MENASIHYAGIVKKRILEKFEWVPIFDVAYSPQYNPIETYLAAIKHKYRENSLAGRKKVEG